MNSSIESRDFFAILTFTYHIFYHSQSNIKVQGNSYFKDSHSKIPQSF